MMEITKNEKVLIELVLTLYETLRDNNVPLTDVRRNKINYLFDEINSGYSENILNVNL